MEGEVDAQVSPPLFVHQALPLDFHETASLARKRDSTWQKGSFHLDQHREHYLQRMAGSGNSNPYANWSQEMWDWDSSRFIARPRSNTSEAVPHPGKPAGVADVEQRKYGDNSSKGAEDGSENLALKLGGESCALVEPVSRPNKRVRCGSPGNGGSYPMCQVDDCKADLSNAKDYHRRHKVCEIHSKTTKAMVGKQMQRFCQQCSRFHQLTEFDEGKRSCRRRLAGHNKRRRKTQPEDASCCPLPPSNQDHCGTGNLNIVNLLSMLARLQGNGVDKQGSSSLPETGTGRLMQVLGKLNSTPSLDSSGKLPKPSGFDLNVSQISHSSHEHQDKTDGNLSAPSTMDLLTVLSADLKAPRTNEVAYFPQGSSESSGDENSTKSPESSSTPGHRSNIAPQSSTEISEHSVIDDNLNLRLQLFSSTEDDSSPVTGSSTKYQYDESSKRASNNCPLSSPPAPWRLFPLQSEVESLKHGHIASTMGHNGALIAGTSRDWGSPLALEVSTHPEGRIADLSIQSVPYQQGCTSSSSSDRSPCSSNSDNQERTGRIIFKLFDKDPSNLPGTLRSQILSWLSHSPSDIESYIRPGCVILSIYLSMSQCSWHKLQEDIIQQVNLLIQHSDSDFWRKGRFLVLLDGQLLSNKDGKIRICRTWRTWRAPEIYFVSPLAVVSGKETPLFLRGRNLNVPGTKIRCTYMGGYTSKVVNDSYDPGINYGGHSVESFTLSVGASTAFGRCFLEVDNGFWGNSFPVIIADDVICQELRLLESEFVDVRASKVAHEDKSSDGMELRSMESILHFLNELGWLFQGKSVESYSLLPSFSSTRFRFLLIFSVERDWSALIRKLLDILVERSSANVQLMQESLEMLHETQLLHRAVKRKCIKMVDLLLFYSLSDSTDSSKVYIFPPNIVGPGGITPLHLAASMRDSGDIIDKLTDDPQMIGLNCWTSVVDDNGQSPYSYSSMRSYHSYNELVSRKLADKRSGQISLAIDDEETKPREQVRPNLQFLETMCTRCAIMERRRIKSSLRLQGLLQYPFINPVLAIATVCVCVCLFARGLPELGLATHFKWETLDFGPI